MVHFGEFLTNLKLAVKQCYQTGQKLVENDKFQKFKYDILSYFKPENDDEKGGKIDVIQFSLSCYKNSQRIK